ncbi:MAG TPA: exosortase K [Polyangiaceae bacterium]|nr:exosortase K [Polyangiaceae bacterium]
MSLCTVRLCLRARRSDVAIVLVTLVVCVLVKLHYRSANAAELRWLLGPTAALTGLVTGHEFRFESDAGYVSRELGLAIAPVCAGANYLAIAFAALVSGFVSRFATLRAKVTWFALCAVVTYVATVLTNSLRIGLSVLCRPLGDALGVAGRAQVHRVEGVLVYLVSLLVLYAATAAWLREKHRPRASLWLPLGCYLGVTLFVPLALGARLRGEFAPHALVVLLLSAAVVALSRLLEYTRRA